MVEVSLASEEGDSGGLECRREGSLLVERDVRSALMDDTEDDEELVCWVTDVGWEVFDRELLRGDMALSRRIMNCATCLRADNCLTETARDDNRAY